MMDKEEIIQIRKIIRDEFWELLDAEVLPVLRDYVSVKVESSKVVESKSGDEKEQAAIPEQIFLWLTWVVQTSEKLGDFEVAYQAQHLQKEWQFAYGILERNRATIEHRYHPTKDYVHAYWLYEKLPDRIYRRKLRKEDVSDGSAATG